MVYVRLAVKRLNSIKMQDNTVTTKDMYNYTKQSICKVLEIYDLKK